jgi:tRNA(Ile2) C34 agmatinyltransferase TiaS
MILIGLDDTDSADSRGTNQLAKTLVRTVLADMGCVRIVRHQLLFDSRIPYTSKNGSASVWLDPLSLPDLDGLWESLQGAMLADFIPGSDPGLCLAEGEIAEEVVDFGLRAQREILTLEEAASVAKHAGLRLAGLGGTNQGMIGALAAVGLAATGNDGRVVQIGTRMDELSGRQNIAVLREWGIRVIDQASTVQITSGWVDVGKKLRPNLRNHRLILFAERAPGAAEWNALKVT